MDLRGKYARLKRGVTYPEMVLLDGYLHPVLIDLKSVGYGDVSGRLAGKPKRVKVALRDVDLFDDPVYTPEEDT